MARSLSSSTALPVAVAALCISAGVHVALAVMHVGTGASAELVLFALAALVSVLCISAVESDARTGRLIAAGTLAIFAGTYVASRVAAMPVIGNQPLDVLGTITATIELAGAYAATRITPPSNAGHPAAPRLVCVLIIAYCFLVSFAIPTNHHETSHQGGHSHATAN